MLDKTWGLSLLLIACAGSPLPIDPIDVPDAGSPGTVVTKQGAVHGALEGSTWTYRGIPYAAPPIGPLRWKPPEPHPSWDAVRDALAFGHDCPQLSRDGGVIGDEDCLTLNVWAPSQPTGQSAPVLVFIHGGAHKAGSSSRPVYDGRALSEHGHAVVVTLNYRLGVLGFLAHRALGAENPRHASGNYGYMDQTQALRWVHDNIAAFGGDPSRVMLFGQSAGAFGVCVQLAAPSARGLFSSAIMLSGACGSQGKALAESRGDNVSGALGCDLAADIAACLRGKTVGEVAALPVNDGQATAASAGPVVDGLFLEDAPLNAVTVARVPVIVSTTEDEYTNQLGLYGGSRPVTSAADYEQLVRQLVPQRADAVLALYPASAYPSPNEALIALLSDRTFICPSRSVVRQLSRSGQPVWRAVFAHTFEAGPMRAFRAAHGFDLAFGFRNFGPYTPSPAELALSDTISDAWVRFAATGSVDWPRYDPMRDTFTTLEQPLATGEGVRTGFCDFWGF